MDWREFDADTDGASALGEGAAAALDTSAGHALFGASFFGAGHAACGGAAAGAAATFTSFDVSRGASCASAVTTLAETDWVDIASSLTGIITAEGPSDATCAVASLTLMVFTATGRIGSVEPGV